jgi:hypothetical protein
MKMKHNKKRNTAFLYEVLIRELTKAVVNKNTERKQKVVGILKEHFKKDSLLSKELELYKALCETSGEQIHVAERLLYEVKSIRLSNTFDEEELYREQTDAINVLNKELTPSVFSNFVPNYKNLATVSQIFNKDTGVKRRVVLEESILGQMSSERGSEQSTELVPIDNIVYKTFVKKFNEEYSGILEEQQNLLKNYVLSFSDNGVQLKLFLNEEIGRLKERVQDILALEEIKQDSNMLRRTTEVMQLLEGYGKVEIDISMLKKILKVQNFINVAGK